MGRGRVVGLAGRAKTGKLSRFRSEIGSYMSVDWGSVVTAQIALLTGGVNVSGAGHRHHGSPWAVAGAVCFSAYSSFEAVLRRLVRPGGYV